MSASVTVEKLTVSVPTASSSESLPHAGPKQVRVVAVAAGQGVVARATGDGVVALAAVDLVVGRATGERVVAVVALDVIGRAPAGERVVAGAAEEGRGDVDRRVDRDGVVAGAEVAVDGVDLVDGEVERRLAARTRPHDVDVVADLRRAPKPSATSPSPSKRSTAWTGPAFRISCPSTSFAIFVSSWHSSAQSTSVQSLL